MCEAMASLARLASPLATVLKVKTKISKKNSII